MKLTEKQKYDLRKFIRELEQYRGRHTELVSIYVPAGYDLNKIINHISQEQGTASNIKSSSTRKNVQDALERMLQHLRLFKKTPDNGLIAFSGNVAEREGQSDVRVWSIEPPMPLNTRIYRCDKGFVLDILQDMLEDRDVYGMIVMDRRDAHIAILKGKTIHLLLKTHSEVPGKYKAGGQSAPRFARIREGAAIEHYKKVAEYVKEKFLQYEGLKGLIIGGPGQTKHEFIDHLNDQLKRKIIGVKDLSYTGEFGLQELLDKSQDILANEEVSKEKMIMNKFFELLAKKPGTVAYGENDVLEKVINGVAETVLLSEVIPEDKMDLFSKEALKQGTNVVIISVETREGVQLRDMGGYAAILRYDVGG